MDIELTSFSNDSNWVKGIVGDGEFNFEAKLFDVGSPYGINEGRVSKLIIWEGELNIWNNWDGVIVNYDRGWDIEPENDTYEDIFLNVLLFLEETPTRFN